MLPHLTLVAGTIAGMPLRWYTVVVDCHDIAAQSRWWAQTLGWKLIYEADDEVVIIPPHMSEQPIEDLATWLAAGQAMIFVTVPEGKSVKNRLHLDLAPHTTQDRDAEIAALLARGATRVDVGQTGAESWTVLADPEGNEFCVLSARKR